MRRGGWVAKYSRSSLRFDEVGLRLRVEGLVILVDDEEMRGTGLNACSLLPLAMAIFQSTFIDRRESHI